MVIIDNFNSAYMAVRHLVDMDHQRVGIILGPEQTMTARERLEGAKAALSENGLFNERLVRFGSYSIDNGYETMKAMIEAHESLNAVFCANDLLAIGALKAAQDAGRNVPHDISIIGFDDIMLSRLVNPPLTTVRQPTFDLGATAARMVIERIKGIHNGIHRKVVLPGQLIVRNSTGPPRISLESTIGPSGSGRERQG